MKKQLLMICLLMLAGGLFAQDTITGWSFPVNSGIDSLDADMGTAQNQTYDIRFEWIMTPSPDSNVNTITFADGANSYAAATVGWDNGADKKFWSIKFKAANFSDIKVSSKQKSASTGPRDFKLQWRLTSSVFEDIPDAIVTVGNDWTTGVISNLPAPITGHGSGNIFIRWIQTSNTSVDGGTVAQDAQSMIDDILVTGTGSTGNQEILYTNRIKIGPVPNHGVFNLSTTEPITSFRITDLNGRELFKQANPGMQTTISLPDLKPGLYFLLVRFADSSHEYTSRFIVE